MVKVNVDGVHQEAQPDELLIDLINRTGGTVPQILGSIEPEWFKGIFQAIPEGLAQTTAEREKPIKVFALPRRLTSRDSLRGLAAAVDFLQAFGRHLQSAKNPLPRN